MASSQTQAPHQYLTAGALATRHILDNASYSTTPSRSPPNERSAIFSEKDKHRGLPDPEAIARADEQLETLRKRNSEGGSKVEEVKASTGGEEEGRKRRPSSAFYSTAVMETKDWQSRQRDEERRSGENNSADEDPPGPGSLGQGRRWSWSYAEMKEGLQRAELKGAD